LKATVRNGQVFLTWKEAETQEGTTFNVYKSSTIISDVANANKIAHHIERHSARDWWEDPASFKVGAKAGGPVGFLIQTGGHRLDPTAGLFVDTIARDENGKACYAVTSTGPDGKEDTRIIRGVNSLSGPVEVKWEELRPIWQQEAQPPAPGAGKGKALWLNLHAKGGVVANMEYLLFGDETMGWREGIPFKFGVRVKADEVVVQPTDRVWINRPHREASDAGTPAIWTFWYGYNSNIYDRQLMSEGIPTNYTERRNLWILKWVQKYYQTDPNHCYVSGSSMGGCGSISFGLHHPEIFAALHAHVPIVSYTYLGRGSAHRLEPCCWVGPISEDLKTNEGVPLLQRMNGTKWVQEATGDLPFVFIINGRKDASIPWENNPPFYRALNDGKHGFCAYWDDGEHPTCGKNAPEDVKAWSQRFHRFRLDESFPAFSNTSSNRNPGNGQPSDGDEIGWMNRGMDWKDIEDRPDHYSVTISASYPGIQYPVQTDMTLRRLQNFKPKAGEAITVQAEGSEPTKIRLAPSGLITIPQVVIPSEKGIRITVRR
jgi:hypothetical protein